jgi:hypothetical protein
MIGDNNISAKGIKYMTVQLFPNLSYINLGKNKFNQTTTISAIWV